MRLTHILVSSLPILLPSLISTQASILQLETRQHPPPYNRQYRLINECPSPIDLYIDGLKDSTIQTHDVVTKFSVNLNIGPFYSDVNGGSVSGDGSTRVGFHDEYYYVVAGPTLNTGVRVDPFPRPPNSGFCIPIDCQALPCPNTFRFPPRRFPPPTEGPPRPPYFRCPSRNETFDITFCPSGSFPA